MVHFNTLTLAKAHLCWEIFTDLTIQLVPVQNAVGYFFPPNNKLKTIVIYYSANRKDISRALYLLFHEAGHAKQCEINKLGEEQYNHLVNKPNGKERVEFEHEAWDFGKDLFANFIEQHHLDKNLLERYEKYAHESCQSYILKEE